MNLYLVVKTLHILSSTVLFGAGLGIAFFMFRSAFTTNLHEKYFAASNTVLADNLLTLPAAFIQPLSGAWLVWHTGYDWHSLWLVITYALYTIAGLCWLPVIWIQIQLKKIVAESQKNDTELPQQYHKLFWLWFLLGWPAFIGFIAIFYLMVAKPV